MEACLWTIELIVCLQGVEAVGTGARSATCRGEEGEAGEGGAGEGGHG